MFESFKKSTDEGPLDPNRRKALGTMAGIGVTALSGGALVANEIETGHEEHPTNPSLVYPTVTSGPVPKFESARPIIMEQLVHTLRTEGKDAYILAIEFLTGLETEKAALLGRKVHVVDELKKIRNSNPKQPFLLLENDRINKSLAELNTYIQEIRTAKEQSPFHNAPAEVLTEKPENKGYIDNQNLPNTTRERKRIM